MPEEVTVCEEVFHAPRPNCRPDLQSPNRVWGLRPELKVQTMLTVLTQRPFLFQPHA